MDLSCLKVNMIWMENLLQITTPFKDFEAFRIFLEAIDELFDKESTIIKEADDFVKNFRNMFSKFR